MEDQQKQAQSEQPTPITQESSASPGPNHEEPPKKSWTGKLSPKKLIMIVITILILTGVVAAFFILKPAPTKKAQLTQKDNSASVDPNCSKDGTTLNATWTAARQKINNASFIKPREGQIAGQEVISTYYSVGTTDKGQAIILFQELGPIWQISGIAIEDKPSHFTLLLKHYTNSKTFVAEDITSDASVDATSYFPELCVSQLDYSGQTLKTGLAETASLGLSNSHSGSVPDASLKILQKYPNGTLYLRTPQEDPAYRLEMFEFQMNDTRWIQVERLEPLTPIEIKVDNGYTISSLKTPDITWLDNSKISDLYSTDVRGCGRSTASEVARGVSLSDLTKIGTEAKGIAVYELTSIDHPLFNLHYKEYQDKDASGRYNDPNVPKNKTLHGLSKEAFKKLRPMFIFKDQFDRFVVYTKGDFGWGGGCGKPVIYLYPTKTTAVTVKVGADVVKSVPLYGNGWSVTAQPNGTLNDGQSTYDSLYWEGFGHGLYPLITSGTIVASDQVDATLKAQLSQLGLTAKESADFLEFWLAKIPRNKPYIRLTWFGTQQMNQLAPLTITPAPDTLIRVFLDAEGLNAAIPLNQQKLGTIPRRGFTVVEWGGLLDGKLF